MSDKREYNTTLCYIIKDGKALMLHRNKKEHDINKAKYIGVGGHIEYGESPEECIVREVKEETGLTMNSYTLRGVITFVLDDANEYAFLYTCDDFSGTLNEECNEGDLEWVPFDKILDLPLWEGDKVFLKLLADNAPFFSLKLAYEHDRLIEVSINGNKE
ncbi:MAG: 8-oxo-dGTP diphosphatase [Lachnospiraceae bacterium]|nr:8-oxo-dGTP diphosphatase [Lachnospiraceae bacterium]